MDKDKNSHGHHVAWADRVGLNKRWEDAIKNCFFSFGTPEFSTDVEAFESLIINVRDGPQLKQELNDFKETALQDKLDEWQGWWIKANPHLAENPAFLRDLEVELQKKKSRIIFNFLIQLLEDNKFVFYKSEFDGEYDQWD